MNVLFYMDPFVEYLCKENIRSFVLRYDMMPHLLMKQFGEEASIKILCYEKILTKQNIKNIFKNIPIKKISENIIQDILQYSVLQPEEIISGEKNDRLISKVNEYFLFENWEPDIIISWGILPEYVNVIYPNTLLLEAEHSGLFRITKDPDVFFLPKNKIFYEKLYNYIFNSTISPFIESKISELAKELKRIADPINILNRSYFGKEIENKKIIFYPGHFKSPYSIFFSQYKDDNDILINILNYIPSNSVIIYLRHPLTKESETPYIVKISDKIIDISYLYEFDNNIALKAISICDLLINSHSKTSFIAYIMGKKVIELDKKFYYNKLAINDIREIENLLNGDIYPEKLKKIQRQYIYFLLTHTSSLKLIQCEDMYKHLLITTYNAYIKDELSKLPIMSTIDEYITNIQNYFLDDAKKDYDRIPTTYDIIKGCIISEKYDNICFDIFDTLVWRPFNKPTDLFYLIAKDVSNILSNERFDFYSARISAEWHARRKSANLGYEDVTLEDIYTSFSTLFNIPQEICKEIADIEKKYELKFIQCRKSTKNLVELALNCNKKVYAVSDMYMSSAFLSKILEKAGYNSFNRIIVSSEYKALKSTGRLFDILNKDLNIKPSKSIFIGDNINSDVLKPMEIGYRVFHYQSALQCFKTKTLFPPFFNTTLTHCIATYLAVIANIIFDNPYLKFDKKTMFNNSQYLVGFIALGPILLNFTSWLIKNIENKNYKILLFSSRDCYFIEKIYKLVKKYYPKQLPTSKYFYISRKATLPCFQDKLNKALLVDKYSSNYSAIEFLNEYFSVDKDSDLIIKNKTYLKKIKNNIIEKTKLQEFIVENEIINDIDIKRKQDMLKNYTLQETQGEEFAIIDSGARGTSRDALSDLLQREIDLYLFRSYRYKFSDKNLTFSYHKESFNYFRSGRAAFTSAFYEPLISCAHEGSCTGYEKLKTKIIPVIDKLENTESQQYIFFVQRGILDFSEKYITIFKNNTVDTIFEPSVEIFKAPLEFVHARMSDAKLFEKFVHYDQLSGFIGNSRILMPPLQISQNSINVKNNNEQNEKCNQQKNIKISSHIKLKKKILLYLEKIICSCLLNGRKHDKYLHNRNMFFIDSKKKILHLWYNYINNI